MCILIMPISFLQTNHEKNYTVVRISVIKRDHKKVDTLKKR